MSLSEFPMESVIQILKINGVEELSDLQPGESISVEMDGPFNDLVISLLMPGTVSVEHVFTQQGDLMSDPEIVFKKVDDGDGESGWRPITYRQDPHLFKENEDGLELDGFPEDWDQNLKEQGFIQKAKQSAE